MKICLIGGTGGMGKAMLSFFKRYNFDAFAVGRKTAKYQELVESADIIMLLVPLDAIKETMKRISSFSIDDAIIINTCSVMSPVQKVFDAFPYKNGHLHLLFGPEFHHFTNQNIAITKEISSISALMQAFELEQANIIYTDPIEHDTYMSAIQGLSHLHTIMLSRAIASLSLDKEKLEQFSTYSFRLNLKTILQIMKQPSELWRSIQFNNPLVAKNLPLVKDLHDSFFTAVLHKDAELFDSLFTFSQTYWAKSQSMMNSLAILGPKGTFSESAALKYNSSLEKIYCQSISEVIDFVSQDKVTAGIVPHENSIHGTIAESLEGIYRNKLFVQEEIIIPIDHCLAGISTVNLDKITDIYSHPQALHQCATYIKKHFPQSKIHETNSTSEAFQKISDENSPYILAIGSEFGARQLNLKILDTRIQDEQNNKTSFFVISKKKSTADANKSLLVLRPNQDKPGLLHDILGIFNAKSINLSKLESRPSRSHLGSYIFFLILETSDKEIIDTISKELSDLFVDSFYLGSFSTRS